MAGVEASKGAGGVPVWEPVCDMTALASPTMDGLLELGQASLDISESLMRQLLKGRRFQGMD